MQQQMTRLQFETASSNKAKINFCGFDEHQDLEIDTETIDSQVKKLQAKLASKEDLLKDAVLEYHSKSEELTKCQVDIQNLSSQLAVSNADLANIQVRHSFINYRGKQLILSSELFYYLDTTGTQQFASVRCQ